MSAVYHSIIRTVVEQTIHRYDKTGNKEEIIDELASILANTVQYYEEYWEEKEVENEHLSLKISDIHDKLSVRSINCLQNAEIETVGDLVRGTQQQLLKYKNFGRKSVGEIRNVLSGMGLTLGMVQE